MTCVLRSCLGDSLGEAKLAAKLKSATMFLLAGCADSPRTFNLSERPHSERVPQNVMSDFNSSFVFLFIRRHLPAAAFLRGLASCRRKQRTQPACARLSGGRLAAPLRTESERAPAWAWFVKSVADVIRCLHDTQGARRYLVKIVKDTFLTMCFFKWQYWLKWVTLLCNVVL